MLSSCAYRPDPLSDGAHESSRKLLSSIQKGMTEQQVLEIMGHPDEIRIKGDLGIVAEKYRWVYGVKRKGGFPRVGSVIFDTNKTVFMTFCPARGISGILSNTPAPFSESQQKTPAGAYCQIDRVFRNSQYYDSHYIQVSLVNEGDEVFLYPHDNTGIRFSLILEVYDDQKNILLREPLFAHHSPYSSDSSKWPVIKVPPGSRESEDVPIWWRDVNDGILYPGTYYVRVAFPFETRKFYGSNLAKWELKETLDKSR